MHMVLTGVYHCMSIFCLGGDSANHWLCINFAMGTCGMQIGTYHRNACVLEPTSKMPALLMSPCNGRCFQCCAKLLTDCREDTSSSMTSALGLALPCSSACSSRDRLSFSPRPLSRQANMTADNTVYHLRRVCTQQAPTGGCESSVTYHVLCVAKEQLLSLYQCHCKPKNVTVGRKPVN